MVDFRKFAAWCRRELHRITGCGFESRQWRKLLSLKWQSNDGLGPRIPAAKSFRRGAGARYFGRAPRRLAEVASSMLACLGKAGLKPGTYGNSSVTYDASQKFPPEEDTGMVKSRVASCDNEAGQQFRGCA